MQIITWNKSLRGISNGNGAKDNYADDDESETHATVLDKLLAWEKKLYEELKVDCFALLFICNWPFILLIFFFSLTRPAKPLIDDYAIFL